MMLVDNWRLKTSVTKLIGENQKEFPLINLGKQFSSQYQLVRIETPDKKDSWDFGGKIYPAFLFWGKYTYADVFDLRIDNQNLIKIPLLFQGEFSLFYKPPNWFTRFTIKIYEYAETIETLDYSENLQQLNQEINNLSTVLASLSSPSSTGTTDPTTETETTVVNLPENLLLKSLLQQEKTFYIRSSNTFGHSGESEAEAFASIEEALIVLANKYEVSGHLILDLDTSHTLNCWYLPVFTGSGKITFQGHDTTITFVKYQDSTSAFFSNWSGLSLFLKDINFVRGDCTNLCVEGGKMNFENIDFGQLNVEFDNCRSTILSSCKSDPNSSQIKGVRSTLSLNRCDLIAQFKYCQLNLFACTFERYFGIEACSVTLNNPRFNYRWFTQTLSVVNSTVEFLNSWLTFENLGGNPQTKNLINFQSCNLKDFPNNIDVREARVFDNTSILKLVNCTTPETFNNVSYNFTKHSFINGASAIKLVNTAILQDINIVGGIISRDAFSILGNENYDNANTGIPANNLQEAIDYLYGLINP